MTIHIATLSLLLIIITHHSLKTVHASFLSDPTDKEALLAFKALITSDPTDVLSSWNESSTTCQWIGVQCDNSSRVTTLDLRNRELSGSISPFIGNLSYLKYIYLQDNTISGAIPAQLGSLLHLEVLNVSSNQISGIIPKNMSCYNLTVFDLSANLISGEIPPQLGVLMPKLQVVILSQNQLSGPIPNSIGNLSYLTTLNLATNNLTGPIPSELGNLKKLKILQISLNKLTGTVPPSLYDISSLSTFALASNNLYGEIPSDIGFRLPNMLVYHSCFNNFTGVYPPSLHNLTKLQSLRMSHNSLHGTVPPGLGNLHDLVMYNIGFNNFTSSGEDGLDIITALTNSSKLEFLAIDGNHFEGVIPESIGDLSISLSKLYLGSNLIYGQIPESLGRLMNLTLLNMSDNSISGRIPEEIGNLKSLRMLGLARNKFSGKIPANLGSLSLLTELELYSNQLEGTIPSTFSQLQKLLTLDISDNKLNGSIPQELLTLSSLSSLLNLSRNSLSGPLPADVGNLQLLVTIDLSNNLLSGNIPNSIGNCKTLQTLLMSNNSFSGLIPNTTGNLKALESLDLSSNQLTGPIPESLETLQALDFLNLSFNNLEGDVPTEGVFRNLSNVYLEGNTKICMPSSPCSTSGAHSQRKLKVIVLVIIVTSIAIVLCLLVGVYWIFFIKCKSAPKVLSITDSFKGKYPMVSFDELQRATGNFSQENLIGTGSFGSVYKGVLRDGMTVAVKVLNLLINGASKSFIAECEAMRNIRHRNLVKLITLCSSINSAKDDFQALVYEFMPNGSLEDWIRGRRRQADGRGLNALEKLNISIDVATALDYLHNDCEVHVVHCDMKPSNVILDADMIAKVGDFGLARLIVETTGGQEYSSTTSNALKGSIGYIPPEYGFGSKPSRKGDVYSYGVMVLELITGKSPVSFAGDLSLVKWVCASYPDGVINVLEPELLCSDTISCEGRQMSPEKQLECMIAMVEVGLRCANDSPDARISIRDALHKLQAIKKEFTKPAQNMRSKYVHSS